MSRTANLLSACLLSPGSRQQAVVLAADLTVLLEQLLATHTTTQGAGKLGELTQTSLQQHMQVWKCLELIFALRRQVCCQLSPSGLRYGSALS